jgi:hypothetical protein
MCLFLISAESERFALDFRDLLLDRESSFSRRTETGERLIIDGDLFFLPSDVTTGVGRWRWAEEKLNLCKSSAETTGDGRW